MLKNRLALGVRVVKKKLEPLNLDENQFLSELSLEDKEVDLVKVQNFAFDKMRVHEDSDRNYDQLRRNVGAFPRYDS